MSAFVEVETKFLHETHLLQALQDLGLPAVAHKTAVQVVGYTGPGPRGEITVAKGSCSDTRYEGFAFKREANGTYTAHIGSHFTRMGELKQRYAQHVVVAQAKAKGYRVIGTETVNGRVKIRLAGR